MISANEGHFGILQTENLNNPPFILLDGGIESRFKEEYFFDNSSRPDYKGYLFQYTLSGEGILEKNGVQYTLQKNHGFLIRFPEESKYYLSADSEEEWKFIFLHFAGDGVLPYWEQMNALHPNTFSLPDESRSIVELINLYQRLFMPQALHKYEGGEVVCRLLCTLLREVENAPLNEGNLLTRNAKLIIDQHYNKLVGIDELAALLNVSLCHLSRTFSENAGITPIQYLTQVRIQSALFELLNSNHTVEAIAQNNGFTNGNYFCKVFKRHMGVSPLEYKRLI